VTAGGSLGRSNFVVARGFNLPDRHRAWHDTLSLSLSLSTCASRDVHARINATCVLTCTTERRQNGESRHDEIAENVGAPHFPSAHFPVVRPPVASTRARDPRSHNNKRTRRLFKGRPLRTLALSVAPSLAPAAPSPPSSRRPVAAPSSPEPGKRESPTGRPRVHASPDVQRSTDARQPAAHHNVRRPGRHRF